MRDNSGVVNGSEWVESYVAGGLAKREACVILCHRQSGPKKINPINGGEAECSDIRIAN
jgi:hypothetical protein